MGFYLARIDEEIIDLLLRKTHIKQTLCAIKTPQSVGMGVHHAASRCFHNFKVPLLGMVFDRIARVAEFFGKVTHGGEDEHEPLTVKGTRVNSSMLSSMTTTQLSRLHPSKRGVC